MRLIIKYHITVFFITTFFLSDNSREFIVLNKDCAYYVRTVCHVNRVLEPENQINDEICERLRATSRICAGLAIFFF